MTQPQTFNAALETARASHRDGDRPASLASLRHALKRVDADYSGLQALGRLAWVQEDWALAVAASNKADTLDPLKGDFQRIRHAMNQHRLVEARRVAETMLDKRPGHPRALYTLAHIDRAERKSRASLNHVDAGLETAPGNMILRHMRVKALEDLGEETMALEEARRLPDYDRTAASVLELGRILMRHGRNEELLTLYDEASDIAFTPEQVGGMELVRGHAHRILGHAEAALSAYRRCIESRTPASIEAWWALSDLTTYRFTAEEIATLRSIVTDTSLPETVRCQPAFALAKAVETGSGLEDAMPEYHRANRFYDKRGFQPERFLTAIETVTARMTPQALSRRVESTSQWEDAARPIFVLGMPRSGSTLVEQILASHSQIEGTHELPALPAVKQSLHQFCVDALGGSYLDHLGDIPEDRLAEAGQAYLSQVRLFREGNAPYFVDKLPQNFEHIGLIHKILPQAVIIDVRRHPMACGLSLYRQYFASGWTWAYDLSHIGSYYRGYWALMAHWDSVLPGRVLHMRYEHLVSDTRAATGAMLDHIGVPFEEACLAFHTNRRAVRTPSSEQVRQPIYAASVDSWKQVESELGPLRAALGEAVIQSYEAS